LSSSAEGSFGHIMGTKAERASKVISFDDDGDVLLVNAFPTYREGWIVSTNYVLNDLVKDTSAGNDNIYICIAAHTSTGTLPLKTNSDLSNWDLVVDLETVTTLSDSLVNIANNVSVDADQNTLFGDSAGTVNETGVHNTFVGFSAGGMNEGDNNTFVGSVSGNNLKGDNNTVVGYASGSTSPSTGSGNILIGNDLVVDDDTDNQLNIGNWITRDTTGAIELTHGTDTKLKTTATGIEVTGVLTGNVTGNVTGDLTGNVTGDLDVGGDLDVTGLLSTENITETTAYCTVEPTVNTTEALCTDVSVGGTWYPAKVTLDGNLYLGYGARLILPNAENTSSTYISEGNISEVGDGDFIISATNLSLRSTIGAGDTGNKYLFGNDSTGEVILYNGTTERVKTTATGVEVTGSFEVDGVKVPKVFVQNAAPTTGHTAGDLWVDSDGYSSYIAVSVGSGVAWFGT